MGIAQGVVDGRHRRRALGRAVVSAVAGEDLGRTFFRARLGGGLVVMVVVLSVVAIFSFT
jgi:hypothetical protein